MAKRTKDFTEEDWKQLSKTLYDNEINLHPSSDKRRVIQYLDEIFPDYTNRNFLSKDLKISAGHAAHLLDQMRWKGLAKSERIDDVLSYRLRESWFYLVQKLL